MPLTNTQFTFSHQTHYYQGKVREVYFIADQYLVMIASDRISAFDVVMPKGIPYKGQILNQLSAEMLEQTKDIVPNWLLDTPDPNASIGHKANPFPVEMVVRGYLAGHAYREYNSGKREICGVDLPDNLKQNQKFDQPIITPTTKAQQGDHDEDISKNSIIDKGLVSKNDYEQLEDYAQRLFARGSQLAAERGLILVDTKYEFGKTSDGKIILIDEVHTPDSSRFFYADEYQQRLQKDEPQKQLSKEFVREWLMENGFQGKENQKVPEFTQEITQRISERYIELYEKVTGKTFEKAPQNDIENRIYSKVEQSIDKLI
ncbi:MAG: phosphoribosylaminoimidazolesuccinocarboxamide synthase [Psychroflexus sp.]|nr:phosphoribosylaminoimidazolesuccinocarboxamide synthase [Psychroflexus sp.]